ncbi:MAG: hypothetical protein ACM31E_04045 [Fibrobacterota bacterium]|nr:hypothetical protein [Chitinispirillaceae bacterium]
MNSNEKKIPCWKAPESLLYHVLEQIDRKQCIFGFFAWPLYLRVVFCIAAFAGIIFGILVSSQIIAFSDITAIVNWKFNLFLDIYHKIMIAHDIVHSIAGRFIWQPVISVAVAIVSVLVLSAWAASIAGLYKLIRSQVRRRLI